MRSPPSVEADARAIRRVEDRYWPVVYVPEPFATPFRGPGKLLSILVSATGIGVTIWKLGAFGCFLFAELLIVIGFVELWRDSKRLSRLADDAENQAELAELESAQTEERLKELPALRAALEEKTRLAERLQLDLSSPKWTLEQLLGAINAHVQALELIRVDTASADKVGAPWPAMTLSLDMSQDAIRIRALVSADTGELLGRTVALIRPPSLEALAVGQVVETEAGAVVAGFRSSAVPEELLAEAEERGVVNPQGLRLTLLGLTESRFSRMDAGAMDELLEQLNRVRSAVERSLMPTDGPSATQGDDE